MQESKYRYCRVVCQELFSAEAPQVFVCLVGIILVSQHQTISTQEHQRGGASSSLERGKKKRTKPSGD